MFTQSRVFNMKKKTNSIVLIQFQVSLQVFDLFSSELTEVFLFDGVIWILDIW
jgi:hypothetical protein